MDDAINGLNPIVYLTPTVCGQMEKKDQVIVGAKGYVVVVVNPKQFCSSIYYFTMNPTRTTIGSKKGARSECEVSSIPSTISLSEMES